VTSLLPRIELPILCLRARHDRVVPAWHADLLVDALPDAHCVDIDAPHLLLQTRPQACARAILEHILGRPATAAKSIQAAENPPQ
jgi:pimeloyl-[acyl-carrier protein] methyl ester esterase